MRKKSILISLFLIMAASFSSAMAEKPSSVLLLPFNIYSKQDYSFLQHSIKNLFSTRLVPECKILLPENQIVEKKIRDSQGNVNEKAAIELGKKLDADYVLIGNLIVFGDSISTDTRLINLHNQKTMITLNQAGNSHGDFLSHISLFAQTINEKIFGRKYFTYTQTPQQKKQVDRTHVNPEKIWTESNKFKDKY